MDVNRQSEQTAVWEDGLVRQAGQITLCDEKPRILAGEPRTWG